jgi:hypothetical protein
MVVFKEVGRVDAGIPISVGFAKSIGCLEQTLHPSLSPFGEVTEASDILDGGLGSVPVASSAPDTFDLLREQHSSVCVDAAIKCSIGELCIGCQRLKPQWRL